MIHWNSVLRPLYRANSYFRSRERIFTARIPFLPQEPHYHPADILESPVSDVKPGDGILPIHSTLFLEAAPSYDHV